MAASVDAGLPALSTVDPGGPITPVWTVNSVLIIPVGLVWVSVLSGLVQPTGTLLPATDTVGWDGSSLHSNTLPGLLALRPPPDTATSWPSVRLLLGLTTRLPVAPATEADPISAAPDSNKHAPKTAIGRTIRIRGPERAIPAPQILSAAPPTLRISLPPSVYPRCCPAWHPALILSQSVRCTACSYPPGGNI